MFDFWRLEEEGIILACSDFLLASRSLPSSSAIFSSRWEALLSLLLSSSSSALTSVPWRRRHRRSNRSEGQTLTLFTKR